MVEKWTGEIMADRIVVDTSGLSDEDVAAMKRRWEMNHIGHARPIDPMSPGAYWRNVATQREQEADRAIAGALRMRRACFGMARWTALAYSVAFGLGLLAGVLGMAWAVGLIR